MNGVKRIIKRVWNIISYSRQKGLDKELYFWNQWMKTKGSDWPEDFAFRFNKESELIEELRSFINMEEGEYKILDIGAGPVTRIGYSYKGIPLKISACDPLAGDYNQLLEKHKLHPPVKSQSVKGEELSKTYELENFNLVTAFNCLDHSEDPMAIVREMLKVCKKDGTVYLSHAANEASTENYRGLHRWNFYLNDSQELIFQSFQKKINVDGELNAFQVMHQLRGDMIHTTIRRKS